MATIRIFNDIFDDKSRDFIYDTSKPLLEQIEEHLDKDYYKSSMVECYDPDTKKTFYAPMEDEDEKEGIILFVNGESVTESYKPSENDIVNVIFTPLSGMSGASAGTLIGLGVGLVLGLVTGGVGYLLPSLAWTAGNVAFATIAGGALGALVGFAIGDKFDQIQKAGGPTNQKTGQQLPDVRGCSNQSLLGNNFPFVIGKHLVTPFIIGDPYTEYSGERGENAYIRELLCVGYGPLKLTDFKLGDFMLAYNRSHNNITKNTMIAGLLKGYSSGGVADNGDIVDYWSKNDVELEIIQQPDGVEIVSIDPYFQDRTKIDLSQRPLVSAETMNASGWNVPAGETCTVYSCSYSNEDESVSVLLTPINPDGTVLSPSELEQYADDCLSAGSYVNTAIIKYNVSYNPAPYLDPYVINSLSLSINYAIDKVIEVQAQFNSNWTTVLTLPAGGVNVSLTGTPRWAGTNCRLKIEDWTSAHFSVSGSGSKNIELHERIEIDGHPYNLLATFRGRDSVQQAEEYAEALHEDQEKYYFERDSIGYGSIYTEVTKETVSDANIFYISDKDLDESVQVTYKGCSFPNQFRTNTVILSEACPRQFTINLDFPSGLYATYTQTVDDETMTKYTKIPLWMCIQWRVYDKTKTSSNPKGEDYDDWNTIDFGPNVNKVFNTSEQNDDKSKHKGNELDHLSLDDLYQGFRGKTLQNFEYYSGEDGLSEFRVSATVTLTKEQCQQVMLDTNPSRIIEIRVLRVSPNYLNQSDNISDSIGPYSYSDQVKVLTTVVKTFDMEALRKDGELKPVRVVSEKDLKKLCLVAIKAKADKAGYLQNNMESITCTAESFSPIWDSESKKILPNGITKIRKYYGYFEGNTDIKANRTNTAYERELTGSTAKQQYEDARHDGYDWYMEKDGSNFPTLIKDEVYNAPVLHNDTLCWYLPENAKKYNNNLASSGALLVLFGEQSGPEAIGLEDLNVVAFSDWAEKSAAVNDGTTAPVAMDYNGHHYNKDDLIPVRYEANAYIYQGTKIEDMLQKLAFCGRAAWVIDEAGKVKFIMDAPVDYTKGAINAQNCLSSSNSFNYEEPPAGLFITFHDENDGFENNSFYVWTDGNSEKRYHGSVEQMSIDYVTNNVQVTSLARYTLASRVQNKEILTRKIGHNGIIYSLGDVVLVQSDELLIGDVSGRIQEVIENNGIIYGFIMDSDYEYTEKVDSSGNSVQGVTIIQPSYMGKSNAVTLPLSAPRTLSVLLDYEQVYPVGTENPHAESWYEKIGNEYVLTTDTTVISGHIYYKVIMENYTLRKGITNIVLFGKVIGDQYGVPRDTSEDYSVKSDIKYNFKTGDIAMLGLIEKISAPYRISKIKPEAGGKFTETLIPYDESFYNYGEALPTFQSYITPPQVTEAPVSLSEVPTTLKEQNDTLQTIYNAIGVPYDPASPALPSSIEIIASRDYISLAWVNTSPNVKHTIIELSKQNGAEGTWTQVAVIDSDNWRYNFNRSTDGYPEADSGTNKLSTWRFRFKNVSICDVESAFTTAQSVTYTNYGTWIPATPIVSLAKADKDGIDIAWSVDTNNRYGTPKYKVVVRYNNIDHNVNINANLTARFLFNRNESRHIDAYPEYTDLSSWSVKVTNTNESDSVGVTTTQDVDSDDYGTWIPKPPSFNNKIPAESEINIDWNAPVTSITNRQLYGNNRFEFKVKYNGTLRQSVDTSSTKVAYTFNRSASLDYYPEKNHSDVQGEECTGLDLYTFDLKVYNESGAYAEITNVSFNQSEIQNYGTWKPFIDSTYLITKNAEEDGIDFEWKTATGDSGSVTQLYGGVRYTLDIKYNGSNWTSVNTDSLRVHYVWDRTTDKYPERHVNAETGDQDLSLYTVNLTATSTITGRSTSFSSFVGIDDNNYKTWKIPTMSVQSEVLDRTAILTAIYTGDSIYGTPQLMARIKRRGNLDIVNGQTFNSYLGIAEDSQYYEPEFEESPQPSSVTDTEGNYCDSTSIEFFKSNSNKITHTLPLLGQTPRLFDSTDTFIGMFSYQAIIVVSVTKTDTVPSTPVEHEMIHYTGTTSGSFVNGKWYIYNGTTWDTVVADDVIHYTGNVVTGFEENKYYQYSTSWSELVSKTVFVPTIYKYELQLTNESGNVSNVVEREITALCTAISDLVHSHEHYKDLYVEKLSAISANIGMISQGGMGSFDQFMNYWALSDLSAEDTGVAGGVKKGAFRVGGQDQYFKVTPLGEGQYDIELKAGNITLTSQGDGTSFTQGTYIYDANDSNKRLALTPTGIIAQQNINEGTEQQPNWQWNNVAKVIIDTNGNLLLTNSDEANSVKYGFDVEGADIYHFESNTLDESGANPQNLVCSGNITQMTETMNSLISIDSSTRCFNGKITKQNIVNYTGSMVVFSKSEGLVIGDKLLKYDGTFDSIKSDSYNELMSEPKDDWGRFGIYLGLSTSQISGGIFTE